MAKKYKIQQRYDTAANWESANPVLLIAEYGIVSDSVSGEYKVGDGKTPWNGLPMFKHWDGSTGQSVDTSGFATKEELAQALAKYVEKVVGKGLSTNDFTTVLKEKLEGLENYDDAAVQQAIQTINTRIDTLVGTSASTAIDNFNEIEAFLQGITDSQSLTKMLSDLKSEITALIPSTEGLATKGEVSAVEGKIPTTTSQLQNNSNFVADASYVHTDNNFTTEEKEKLARLHEGGGTPVTPGTTDYSQLKNKPQINGHELSGNKSLHELGIQPEGEYALKTDIPDTSGFAKATEVRQKNDEQDEKLRTLEGEIGDVGTLLDNLNGEVI